MWLKKYLNQIITCDDLLVTGMIGIFGGLIAIGLYAIYRSEEKCRSVPDHVTEKVLMTTSEGCVIKEITRYLGCREMAPIYVTNCRGSVQWRENQGKTSIQRMTITE